MPFAAAFVEELLCTCLFCTFQRRFCLGVLWRVCNAVLQQFPSLLTAETNYVCNAGLGKRFLTACQND